MRAGELLSWTELNMRLLLLPGDGIGPEISAATRNAFRSLTTRIDEEHGPAP